MLEYFNSFKKYAFRLELLQSYSVAKEKEWYSHFITHGILLEEKNNERHSIIKKAKNRWAKMDRIHILDFPLSKYIQYEIEVYKWNINCWENIYFINKLEYNNIIKNDYRLFDDEIVLIMQYDINGNFIWYKTITNDIDVYIQEKEKMIWQGRNINDLY